MGMAAAAAAVRSSSQQLHMVGAAHGKTAQKLKNHDVTPHR